MKTNKKENKIANKEIYQIIIEGHDAEEMQELLEEIQNDYRLYDNCVLQTTTGKDTIIDKQNNNEFGYLIIDDSIVQKYGE
jgi:hypothetical protein